MEKKTAKVIRASRALNIKAGSGEISKAAIEKAELAIEKNAEDFKPLAQSFLDRLQAGIETARLGQGTRDELVGGMARPVMDLKANARMFKYDLVTRLANIMLDFLESLRLLDATAIDIVAAHQKTLSLIVARGMSGTGGDMGPVLERELASAIGRYRQKKTLKSEDA